MSHPNGGPAVQGEYPSQDWSRLALATGVTGLVGMVMLFSAVIAISSLGEPPLDAPSGDAAAFFRDLGAEWAQAAEALASVGMLVFLWFIVGFALLLRRAEGDPPWRSGVVFASGVLFSAYGVLDASWDAAAHRGGELDDALAGYAFDVGNIGFANAWLTMASFAAAAGWVVVATGMLPTWTGWMAVCSGAGLLVARFLWHVDGLWFLPYGLVWAWVIVTCVYLIRGRAAGAHGR